MASCQERPDGASSRAADDRALYLDDSLACIFTILRSHPDGISEYDLLRELQLRDESLIKAPFEDDLALFRAHFLLFNALYRLRDQLLAVRAYWLEIHALAIVLRPLSDARTEQAGGLVQADPLRAYYLDIDELANNGAEEVEALLGSFWSRYLAAEGRGAALAELGLAEPVSRDDIQRRYRELAMRHHPDRGGDEKAFQRLVSARRLLARCGD